MKYFPDGKTFNLNLNTFIPLCTMRLKEELLLKDNFEFLMKYHFSNYIFRMKLVQKYNYNTKYITFINYLREIIKLEEKIDKIDKNKISILKEDDKKYIKYVLNHIKDDDYYKKDNINVGINYGSKNNINNCPLDDDEVINYLYIYHKSHKLIPLPSEETYNLINYFKLNYINIQTEEKSNKIDDSKDNRIILKSQ